MDSSITKERKQQVHQCGGHTKESQTREETTTKALPLTSPILTFNLQFRNFPGKRIQSLLNQTKLLGKKFHLTLFYTSHHHHSS